MTVAEILARRAQTDGAAPAFTWVADGELAETHLTFGELHARACAVAALLANCTKPGDRAVLLHADALDFVIAFMGCLFAGVIAVPAYPPNPARLAQTRARFLAVVDDARPAVLLTTRALAPLCAPLAAERAIAVVCGDAAAPATFSPRPGEIAFLQYTSGSTASPKGVVVSHANILANLEMIRAAYALDARSRFVSWLPLYHDMGLMAGFLGPLVWGAHSVLLPPWRVLERPVRWLRAMTRHRADASPAPNFGFELAARKITPAELAGLDLSAWRVALDAAEPVRPATLDRFAERFAPAGFDRAAFYPTYGLAEVSVFACAAPRRATPTVIHADGDALAAGRIVRGGTCAFVALGGAPAGTELRIVAAGREVARGEVGEIWLAGPHVAAGYWQNPEATAAAFGARLPTTDARFLRTGDLGFVDGGELYVVGRIKDLIIVRGKNHAPEDLEYAIAQACPLLRPGSIVAFAQDDGAEEHVVIVAEASGPVDADAIARACREAIELPIHTVAIVAAGQVPKTSSGKVQRAACRRAYAAGELAIVATATTAPVPDTRSYLRGVLAQVLAVRPETLDPTHSVRGLGLDSLKAVELKIMIEDELGLEVRLEELRADATIVELAALVDDARAGIARPVIEIVRTGSAWDAFSERARAQPEALALVTATRRWTREQLARAPIAALAAAARSGHADATPPAREGELYAVAPTSEAAARDAVAALGAGAVVALVDETVDPHAVAPARPLEIGAFLFPAGDPGWFANLEPLVRAIDELGFHAIWLPERHFHAFGAPLANPSVIAAAIAGWTSRVRIRAGSVVLPLHHPVRVVEEWAMVDNLSNGRVDLAFAAGRNIADFVLAPAAYADRREGLRRALAIVRGLWRGEPFHGRDGLGGEVAVVTQPRPIQPELPVWLTTSRRPETFELAGAVGANVFTALMEHELDELTANIARYRAAHAGGRVSLMLHTYLDEDAAAARQVAGAAFKAYLSAFLELWHRRDEAHALAAPTAREAAAAVELGFERYARRAALFGGEAAARDRLGELQAAGVDEVACLVDFGVAPDAVLRGLERLARVRDALHRLAAAPLPPTLVRRRGP